MEVEVIAFSSSHASRLIREVEKSHARLTVASACCERRNRLFTLLLFVCCCCFCRYNNEVVAALSESERTGPDAIDLFSVTTCCRESSRWFNELYCTVHESLRARAALGEERAAAERGGWGGMGWDGSHEEPEVEEVEAERRGERSPEETDSPIRDVRVRCESSDSSHSRTIFGKTGQLATGVILDFIEEVRGELKLHQCRLEALGVVPCRKCIF